MEYTYEIFKGEFENSSSPEEKQNTLIAITNLNKHLLNLRQ